MDRLLEPGRSVRTVGWAVICFLILPILVIFPVSVTDRRYLSLPQHGISFEHYANLFTSPEWLGSIGQSLLIGVVSSAIAVTTGTLCAIGCWRLSSRLGELVRGLMLVPIVVPTIVYAIGIYRFWVDLRLLDTYTGVILVHAVTGIPYVVITVSTALAGFDQRLEQAARNLGASMPQTLWRVVLPSILPGVVSGAIFAFIQSWDELVIVLFIASRAIFTLPRRIWDGINEHLDPTMAAVAAILVLLSTLLLVLDLSIRRKREG
jgi:putative spermidine/putrescine transport system permease protein